MLDEGVVEQFLEQDGVFSIGDTPADDAAAEDIEDDGGFGAGFAERMKALLGME